MGFNIRPWSRKYGAMNLYSLGLNVYRKRYLSEPIITVNLGLTKFYVVISPDLMAAVQRNSRAFSFAPLLDLAAERIAGLKGDSLHAFRTTESGGRGLVKDAIHASSPLLSGKSLDKLNQDMFDNLQPMIDELSTKDSFDLVGWIRNAMTVAGTKATYGPLNPFKPKEVQDAFWYATQSMMVVFAR